MKIILNKDIPPIIPNGLMMPINETITDYALEVKTVEQVKEQDKYLLTEEEWAEVEGDDEDIMIAQHNKTLQSILSQIKEVDTTRLILEAIKEFERTECEYCQTIFHDRYIPDKDVEEFVISKLGS